jgi:hypothetical protein
MKDGRWFSPANPSEASDSVSSTKPRPKYASRTGDLAGSCSELLGLKSAARVIGVVREFHYDALHHAIQPAMISSARRNPVVYVRLEKEICAGHG